MNIEEFYSFIRLFPDVCSAKEKISEFIRTYEQFPQYANWGNFLNHTKCGLQNDCNPFLLQTTLPQTATFNVNMPYDINTPSILSEMLKSKSVKSFPSSAVKSISKEVLEPKLKCTIG